MKDDIRQAIDKIWMFNAMVSLVLTGCIIYLFIEYSMIIKLMKL